MSQWRPGKALRDRKEIYALRIVNTAKLIEPTEKYKPISDRRYVKALLPVRIER